MVDYRDIFGISELSSDVEEGSGVKIAVLDTGIPSVEDFRVCLSSNFTGSSNRDTGHATFIGSLLFGKGRIHGICANATPCFGKVFNGLTATPETVASAISYAVDNWHADIINMSFGFFRDGGCPDQLKRACAFANSKGVILVAAAGNDGGKAMWPAALPEVICVGSERGGEKESFSNVGEVDFVVSGRDLDGLNAEGELVKKNGTSFSTAVVTGMVALVLAKRRKLGMASDPDSVKRSMIDLCADIGDPGWDPLTGYGIPFRVKPPALISNSIFGKIKALIRRIITTFIRRIHGNG